MVLLISIFFISLLGAYGMILFRAWQLRSGRVALPENGESSAPDLSFRHVEKSMLYLTKHIVQGIVLVVAKYWFTLTTKIKKWAGERLPKMYSYFQKKTDVPTETAKISFFKRAILESQAKIKRVKEKVKKEHEEKVEKEETPTV